MWRDVRWCGMSCGHLIESAEAVVKITPGIVLFAHHAHVAPNAMAVSITHDLRLTQVFRLACVTNTIFDASTWVTEQSCNTCTM